MGHITEDFIQRAMRCCQLGQHPSLTVWETRQLLTAWVEWQGCRDERDKLDEANRVCEQWRQWTVAARADNEALRARVAAAEADAARYRWLKAEHDAGYIDVLDWLGPYAGSDWDAAIDAESRIPDSAPEERT